jgi:hypothetical protein
MPHLNIEITKAWRHRNEIGRIHYTWRPPEGGVRHLIADEGSAMYGVLEAHLAAQDYTGPRVRV